MSVAPPIGVSWIDDLGREHIPMSRDEYDALPESDRLFEWADGEAIEMITAIPSHQVTVMQLGYALISALPHLKVMASAALDMPDSVRIPDVMVVTDFARDAKRITEPALVAIEVLSPSTWREDLERKPDEYGAFGVQQYWTVDLVQRTITIRENVGGEWIVTRELTEANPTADVPIADHGTVHLDLRRIAQIP